MVCPTVCPSFHCLRHPFQKRLPVFAPTFQRQSSCDPRRKVRFACHCMHTVTSNAMAIWEKNGVRKQHPCTNMNKWHGSPKCAVEVKQPKTDRKLERALEHRTQLISWMLFVTCLAVVFCCHNEMFDQTCLAFCGVPGFVVHTCAGSSRNVMPWKLICHLL